jgi:hypothetical protein
MDKVKMIKKDASIGIKVGAGFLQKLQKLLFFIAADLTEEQLDQFKKEAESFKEGSQFSEDWMEHITTISVLLKELEKAAEEQGFTYEEDINNLKTGED